MFQAPSADINLITTNYPFFKLNILDTNFFIDLKSQISQIWADVPRIFKSCCLKFMEIKKGCLEKNSKKILFYCFKIKLWNKAVRIIYMVQSDFALCRHDFCVPLFLCISSATLLLWP